MKQIKGRAMINIVCYNLRAQIWIFCGKKTIKIVILMVIYGISSTQL